MLSPILNFFSTNESTLQSPKKSNDKNYSNTLLPRINLNLHNISEELNCFFKEPKDNWRLRNLETTKKPETTMNDEKIHENIIQNNLEKESHLLDFDFLVGEILDKINFKNKTFNYKTKKKKKDRIMNGKINKRKKNDILNPFIKQKSK